jgi:AcrR family transcriptional regulator
LNSELINNRMITHIKNTELIQKKQLQIAQGASKLFVKKGSPRTTIREIAKETGLTIGNLYDYITEKEDILYLVFDVFYHLWANRLEEEGVLKIEDPVEQLKTAIRKMLELVNSYREIMQFMYTETKLLPKHYLKIILSKESSLVEDFEKILKRGIEKRAFKIKDSFIGANIIVYLLAIEPLRGWNLKRYKIEEVDSFIEEFILRAVSDGR